MVSRSVSKRASCALTKRNDINARSTLNVIYALNACNGTYPLSLSDHRYIVFRIGDTCDGHTYRHARWNTKSLDRELFEEILTWLFEEGFPVESVEGLSLHIAGMVSTACGVSAKRLKFFNTKCGVFWWNDEVAQSRKRCIAAKRLLTRKRRRGDQCDSLMNLYKTARTTLCKCI